MKMRTIAMPLYAIFAAALFSCGGDNRQADPGQTATSASEQSSANIRFVTADDGLRMRSQPSLTADIVTVLPFNAEVTLMSETGTEMEIDGARGKWSRISWQEKNGWVFGGFLSEKKLLLIYGILNNATSLDCSKLEQQTGDFFEYFDPGKLPVYDNGMNATILARTKLFTNIRRSEGVTLSKGEEILVDVTDVTVMKHRESDKIYFFYGARNKDGKKGYVNSLDWGWECQNNTDLDEQSIGHNFFSCIQIRADEAQGLWVRRPVFLFVPRNGMVKLFELAKG
ncbi:MAG: SH3 domain-containing protein, partial [Spirochaetaceae bacterium]